MSDPTPEPMSTCEGSGLPGDPHIDSDLMGCFVCGRDMFPEADIASDGSMPHHQREETPADE